MNKFTYIFLIILFGFSVNDVEKHSCFLDWDCGMEVQETSFKLAFDGCEYLEPESMLPYFVRIIPIANGKDYKVHLTNQKFEEFEFDSNADSDLYITDQFQVNSFVAKSGDRELLEVDILPLKKINGIYYRLTKFDLQYTPVNAVANSTVQHAWKSGSVLGSGKWVKIRTTEKGIYKIPYSTLLDWGFSNPASVNLFGNNGYMLSESVSEIEHDDLEQISIWQGKDSNNNDCLFFYATGSIKWNLKSEENRFAHTQNVYTASTYYFLSEEVGNVKIAAKYDEVSQAETHLVEDYDAYFVYEKELHNLIKSGKSWFGENFINGTNRTINLETTNRVDDSPARITVNAVGRSDSKTKLSLNINSSYVDSINFSSVTTSSNVYVYANESLKNMSFVPSGDNLSVSLTYLAKNSTDEAWLDYIELNYRSELSFVSPALTFRDIGSIGSNNIARYAISNSNSDLKVFDITDEVNMIEVPVNLNGDVMSFKRPSSLLSEYIVFNPKGSLSIPEKISEVENQDLHATSGSEMIVISHPDFLEASNELSDFHESYDGMDVLVVTSNQVFNEFGSGMPDVTSIRNFIKMSREKNSNLKYILLVGDGTYDNRNILGESNNYIPTFQSDNSLNPTGSFVTDDYFVLLDEGETVRNGRVDLGIGRIPCSSLYEAGIVVDKIKNYYNPKALGNWRNVISFIADDQDGENNNGKEIIHMTQSEELASLVNEENGSFVTNKIYLDAYPEEKTSAGERYPDVVNEINKRVEDGVLILNYVGHANERFLSDEHVLDVANINSWTNENNLPIFVTATCEFSRYDDDESSAGEHILFNPSGGGIGLFSTTRLVFSGYNFNLSQEFYKTVFQKDENGKNLRLGDIMKNAKVAASNGINKRNFSLLADPALRLAYPLYNVKTTSFNQHSAEVFEDTVRALDKVTISGYVEDFEENKLTDFNGRLTPVVYGKAEMMETLGNDTGDPVPYKVQDNVIYKGLVSVTNGEFSFSFVVPKDIPYSLGIGKIVYYAENGANDANGAFENFYIGGSSNSQITDDVDPNIQLYIDDTDFKSGGETGRNPVLLAFLSDDNGINTVGTGIGHDITCVVDGDYSNSIVLNSYYESDIDKYNSGTIEYPLNNLSIGTHTLSLKVWDVANNSSEAEIEFVVKDNLKIEEVYNFPNPVNGATEFVFKHNQPNAVFDTKIEIIDRNGRIVDSFIESVPSSGSKSIPINWDPNSAEVNMMDGVYLYRITIKDNSGSVAAKTGKLIFIE